MALGFYQGAGTDLRLGEEFHHSSFFPMGASSILATNHRSAPAPGRAWDRNRVHRTVARMLGDGTLSTAGLLTHTFSQADAAAAFDLVDRHHRRDHQSRSHLRVRAVGRSRGGTSSHGEGVLFNYAFKGLQTFRYDHYLKEAIESTGEHTCDTCPTWDFYGMPPGWPVPVIRSWRLATHGSGATLAYMSDPAPHWGVNFVQWDQYRF